MRGLYYYKLATGTSPQASFTTYALAVGTDEGRTMIASQLFLPPEVASDDDALLPAGRVRVRLLPRPLPAEMVSIRHTALGRDNSIEAGASPSTLARLQVLSGSLIMLAGQPGRPPRPARLHAMSDTSPTDSSPEDDLPENGTIYCSPPLLHNLRSLVSPRSRYCHRRTCFPFAPSQTQREPAIHLCRSALRSQS